MVERSYLSDILVSHPADLLDVCRGLGDSLEGVAGQNQLVLLGLGDLDIDTGLHDDFADELFADEVSVQPKISAPTFILGRECQCPLRGLFPLLVFLMAAGFQTYRISTS